jgi:hypothetical protein
LVLPAILRASASLLRIAASGASGIKRLLGLRRLCSGLGGCLFSSGHFGGQCGITGFGGEFLLGCSDGVLSVSSSFFGVGEHFVGGLDFSGELWNRGFDVLGGFFCGGKGGGEVGGGLLHGSEVAFEFGDGSLAWP